MYSSRERNYIAELNTYSGTPNKFVHAAIFVLCTIINVDRCPPNKRFEELLLGNQCCESVLYMECPLSEVPLDFSNIQPGCKGGYKTTYIPHSLNHSLPDPMPERMLHHL